MFLGNYKMLYSLCFGCSGAKTQRPSSWAPAASPMACLSSFWRSGCWTMRRSPWCWTESLRVREEHKHNTWEELVLKWQHFLLKWICAWEYHQVTMENCDKRIKRPLFSVCLWSRLLYSCSHRKLNVACFALLMWNLYPLACGLMEFPLDPGLLKETDLRLL